MKLRRLFPILFLLTARPTRADWAIGAGTEFPFTTGAEAALFVDNLRFGLGIGTVLGPYVKGMNGIATGMGLYDQNVGDLVDQVLPGALVIDLRIAYENLFFRGFFIEGRYSYTKGGGGLGTATLLSVLLNRDVSGGFGGNTSLPVSGTIQQMGLHTGYRWAMTPSSQILFKLGVLKPVASSTEIEFNNANGPIAATINRDLTARMNDSYKQVWLPTFSLTYLYRFDPPPPAPVAPAPGNPDAPLDREPSSRRRPRRSRG